MPRISSFYGILVRMYWNEANHAEPHFHAEYGSDKASIGVDGTVLGGSLPPRCLRLVREWAELHREEVLANWTRGRRHEALEPIEPLT